MTINFKWQHVVAILYKQLVKLHMAIYTRQSSRCYRRRKPNIYVSRNVLFEGSVATPDYTLFCLIIIEFIWLNYLTGSTYLLHANMVKSRMAIMTITRKQALMTFELYPKYGSAFFKSHYIIYIKK